MPGEQLVSARLAHCPEPRRTPLHRTDTGRSALVAGTGLRAPEPPSIFGSMNCGIGLESGRPPLRANHAVRSDLLTECGGAVFHQCLHSGEPLRSWLPNVSRQETRCGRTGQTSEAAGAEAHDPGHEPRCPGELIERDTEYEGSEKSAAKAEARIQRHGCSTVARSRDGEKTRGEIGRIALHRETSDQRPRNDCSVRQHRGGTE